MNSQNLSGTHNPGWVQDPGYPASKNEENFPELEEYVKDIGTFAEDDRILLWDLCNEPGNNDEGNDSMSLLKEVFSSSHIEGGKYWSNKLGSS